MNHSDKSKVNNVYLDQVTRSIEKKRRFSIENANKTDLYSDDEFASLMTWFDELIRLAKESPPKDYVRTILMYENDDGQITAIQYEYFNTSERLTDIDFKILYKDS